MRLYRPKYKNKKGKWKEVKKFWVEVVDRREKFFRKVLRFSAFESENLSRAIGDKIQKLINYAALDEPNPDLTRWFLSYTPTNLQNRLIEIGLLPARIKETKEIDKPLLGYLPDFHQAIYREAKKNRMKKTTTTDKSSRITTARVRKLIEGCGFTTWRDVSGEKVDEYIEGRPGGMSQQTAHAYIQCFRRFIGWLFGQGYIDKEPKLTSVTIDKNYGRAYELDEFERLLEAARTGSERYGLIGHQRFLLYLVAVETGLRCNELRSLTVASFDPKNSCLFVKGGVDGDTKNLDSATQYITPDTAKLLQEYVKGKMPNVQLFKIDKRSAKMIQTDCEAAGIEIENNKGKLNFHSLRHTCGSYLTAQGVAPKTVMEIMRHKSINLTMSRYTHLLRGAKQKAINSLPKFGKDSRREKSA